jgi:predicted RNase H-like HicB family nuclease
MIVTRRKPGRRRLAAGRRCEFTAVYLYAEEGGYLAYAEELVGVHAQGETLEEAERNLVAAIQLFLESNRTLTVEAYGWSRVATRKLITVMFSSNDRVMRRARGEA